MKTRIAVVSVIVFASACGIVSGQIPIDPQNRIVNGKVYNPQRSTLWIDVARDVTERCARLEVTSVGKISIGCAVYRNVLDDGGRWGVYKVIGEKYVKEILIYNHPAHEAMTTGTVILPSRGEIYHHPARNAMIYAPSAEKAGTSPTTKPFLAMRVENWRTNGVSLEVYDCGLPDTVANRQKAGIPIPSAADLEDLARKELAAQAAAKKAFQDKERVADAKVLKWNQEQADKGDSLNLFRMGERYRDGDGVPKDLAISAKYFKQADEAAEVEANKLYQEKKLNEQKAKQQKIDWHLDQANKGNVASLVFLGKCYLDGYGVEKDLNKAKEYFRKALSSHDVGFEKERLEAAKLISNL